MNEADIKAALDAALRASLPSGYSELVSVPGIVDIVIDTLRKLAAQDAR